MCKRLKKNYLVFILLVVPVLAVASSWFSAVQQKSTATEQSSLKTLNLDAITEGKKTDVNWQDSLESSSDYCICYKICFKLKGEQTHCSHIVNEKT